MADKCSCTNSNVKDKVCIHTDKVYDSCREKDCLEDLKVYLTRSGQEIADKAISVILLQLTNPNLKASFKIRSVSVV